jgi:DNA invertase Pin-like site-specific DNA recombinase
MKLLVGYSKDQESFELKKLRRVGCATIYTCIKQALDDLRPEDTLVVASLDVIARNTRELLTLAAKINRKSAQLYSLDDREAWVTEAGRALRGLAAFEARCLRREQEAGRALSSERGVPLGRPPKLSPRERQEAIELYASGLPQAEVARVFGVSPSVICNLIARDHAKVLEETFHIV